MKSKDCLCQIDLFVITYYVPHLCCFKIKIGPDMNNEGLHTMASLLQSARQTTKFTAHRPVYG